MPIHEKRLDVATVLDIGVEARNLGFLNVQNMAIAVLVHQALIGHPLLRLRLYMDDPYCEDVDEHSDLVSVSLTRGEKKLRLPLNMLTDRARNEFLRTLEPAERLPREESTRRPQRKEAASEAAERRLANKLVQCAGQIPMGIVRNVRAADMATA